MEIEKNKPDVYKKHLSFTGFYSNTPENVESQKNRIVHFLNHLDFTKVAPDYVQIIKNVHQDLISVSDKKNKFSIKQNIADELVKLSDDQLVRYLYHRYRYDVHSNDSVLDNFPPYVQIEPASICNFKCVFCYQTDKNFTDKANGFMGYMPLETFKLAIDKIEGKVDFVSLSSRGEPTLAKDLDKMLEYCQGKFLNLKINTNASLLKESVIHSLLSGAIQTVVFSADAAEEPLYSQLRVNGTLEKTLKNIELFQNIRSKHYSDSKVITRVSGVMVDEKQTSESMIKLWASLTDQVTFVTYNPWENVYDSPVSEVLTPCSDLWRRMFIWFDGKANPCDTDYKSHLCVGNIKQNSLQELWHSEKYTQLREAHMAQKRGEIEPCKRCVVV